ncbi:MAG TPA: FAD:protein FMN transferase, partial [Candidatus Ratteibacteria bacterium]|nr:FAD:protein FMN transferase [Candidatus Ratteibacteria bacterium]
KVDELEKKLSIFEKESEVSKLNKNKSASVSNETIEVIKKAIEISKITDGAFDISCKPLVDLYKKCEKSGKPPGEEEIKNTLKKVNWKNIEIKGNNVSLKNGMEIDLGGIAKGYIVDKAVEFLKSKGIKNGLVNAGGDLYCWGNNPSGKKWKIAIRDPFEKEKTIGKINITEKSVATSGDYEQYVKIKGQKFSHIVDPRTGKTVQDFPVSVTVIANNCTTADALATGFFVIGTKSIEIANKLKDVEILIIDKDKKNYKSKHFPL